MTKHEFLSALQRRLSSLPADDIEKTLQYYSEMIDDMKESGMSEADAVASLGPIDDIAGSVLSDRPEGEREATPKRERRKLSVIAIILIALGSPVWLSLLAAVLSVVFSVAVSVLSVFIAFYASAVALIAVGATAIVLMFLAFSGGAMAVGVVNLGLGLAGLGFGVLLFIGTYFLTVLTVKGIKWLILLARKRTGKGGRIFA